MRQKTRQGPASITWHKVRELGTDHPLHWRTEDASKRSVAIEDGALLVQRDGTLLDFLDQHPIGPISGLQRIDSLRTTSLADDYGIHLTSADCLECLLCFAQSRLKLNDAASELVAARWFGACFRRHQ